VDALEPVLKPWIHGSTSAATLQPERLQRYASLRIWSGSANTA